MYAYGGHILRIRRYLWGTLFVGVSFFFCGLAPVAAADISFSVTPQSVGSGSTATVVVMVDPAGASVNIVQAQLQYDPAALSVLSCAAGEGFKGIAGQPACRVDAGGVVRLQMESTAVHGPTTAVPVATLTVQLTSTAATLTVAADAQIVGQNSQGESQLLPLSSTVPITVGRSVAGNPSEKLRPSVSADRQPVTVTVPPEEKQGFLARITSWVRQLLRF